MTTELSLVQMIQPMPIPPAYSLDIQLTNRALRFSVGSCGKSEYRLTCEQDKIWWYVDASFKVGFRSISRLVSITGYLFFRSIFTTM